MHAKHVRTTSATRRDTQAETAAFHPGPLRNFLKSRGNQGMDAASPDMLRCIIRSRHSISSSTAFGTSTDHLPS